jgi:hypothetical protein
MINVNPFVGAEIWCGTRNQQAPAKKTNQKNINQIRTVAGRSPQQSDNQSEAVTSLMESLN